MSNDKSLRAKAIKLITDSGRKVPRDLSTYDLNKLLEELEIFHIELELQGEELKGNNEQLVASRKNYSDLFNLAPVGYIITDKSLKILKANINASKLLGPLGAPLTGKSFNRFVSRESQDEMHFHVNRMLDKMGDDSCELRLKPGDGKEFLSAVNSTPLVDKDGNVSFMISIADISIREKMESRLKNALQQKDMLISEIHHRVNNNLNLIHSLVGLEAQKAPGGISDTLMKVNSKIRTIALIYKQLYLDEEFSSDSLQEIVEALCVELSQHAQDDGKGIRCEVEVDNITLAPDAAIPIALILNELIDNCYCHAFAEKGTGEIMISLESSGDSLVLRVSDTGCGIPESKAGEHKSVGGLSIVETLVGQLGAETDINSDQGTTVEIRMPAGKFI